MLIASRPVALLSMSAVIVAALTTLPSAAQDTPSFKSLHVELPATERTFPDGPGADAVNSNCIACHSAGMVLNQPNLPRAAWEAEVNKMRNVYKAPVAADDVPAIVDYLTRLKGSG